MRKVGDKVARRCLSNETGITMVMIVCDAIMEVQVLSRVCVKVCRSSRVALRFVGRRPMQLLCISMKQEQLVPSIQTPALEVFVSLKSSCATNVGLYEPKLTHFRAARLLLFSNTTRFI